MASIEMRAIKKDELNLVDQYLHASCFNKINENTYMNILNRESKADPVEKKLINRIKDQVRDGKIAISIQSQEKG